VTQGGVSLKGKAWRAESPIRSFGPGETVDIAFTPALNTWRGIESVELTLKGLRKAAR
jgi:hypothetical protein